MEMEALLISIVFFGWAQLNWYFWRHYPKKDPTYKGRYINFIAFCLSFYFSLRYLYGFIQWVIWEYL